MTDELEAGPLAANFSVRAVMSCEILLRMIRALTEFGISEDLETMVIYLAVATSSSGGALRDPDLRRRYGSGVPMPDIHHKTVSRRAIAASTGLPRETVRRKIAGLVAQGLLVEDEGGVRTPTASLYKARNLDMARVLVRELETAHDRLGRFD